MIVAAAVCPHPPLLFRELVGLHDPVAPLRSACAAAVSALLDVGPDVVVVVGGATESRPWARVDVDVAGFGGAPRPARRHAPAEPAPLSLRVARRLLDDAGWDGPVVMESVAWDAVPDELSELVTRVAARDDRVAVLVLGEGTARRDARAPGYLDDRAPGFDEDLTRILAAGDVDGLRALDLDLADELMVLGRAAFVALAELFAKTGTRPAADLLYARAPFGVMYLVALWRVRRPIS